MAEFTKYIINKIIKTDISLSDPGILRGKLLAHINFEVIDDVNEYYDDDVSKDYDPFSTDDIDIEHENVVENAANSD
jgi:hypothetical protein